MTAGCRRPPTFGRLFRGEAPVAQGIEHRSPKAGVGSSNLPRRTPRHVGPRDTGPMSSQRVYRLLVRGDDAQTESLAEEARPHVAPTACGRSLEQALQSVGDQIVNAKTVLPWLLARSARRVCSWASWCPIRESGSMLPQAAWAPRVRRRRVRKWVWVAGGAGQAAASAMLAAGGGDRLRLGRWSGRGWWRWPGLRWRAP